VVETMATSKNPVKTGDVSKLVTSQFCPQTNDQKKKINDTLTDMFLSIPEFQEESKKFAGMEKIRSTVVENTASLKQFKAKITKLSKAPGSRLRQEALSYSINTEGLSDDNLRTILVNRIETVSKNVSNVIEENTKLYESLLPQETAFRKKVSDYVANHKKEFRAWKVANVPDNKAELASLRGQRKKLDKKSLEYCSLTNQIIALEDPTDSLLATLAKSDLSSFIKSAYELRLNKDKLSSQCTRFSNSGRCIGAYVREIMTSMVDGLVAVNNQRYKALIASSDNITNIKRVIELVDFDVSRFDLSVYRSIYELLVDTSDLTPMVPSEPAYGILENVTRYVKSRKAAKENKIPAVDKDVVLVIARTIAKFVTRLCDLIKEHFERSNINTIQEKVVKSIMDPYFRFAGVEHPVIIKKAPKKKKVVSSPSS
jgi:hypothetical protein